MITIMQGATKELRINLKNDQLVQQDVTDVDQMTLELYHESKQTVLAKFAYPALTGYTPAIIDGTLYFKYYIDSTMTADFPPGRIIGKFTFKYINPLFDPSGYQSIIGRGQIFNVIM